MTDFYSAKHWAEKARKQATGTMAECPDGSAKHWAQVAQEATGFNGDAANKDLSNLTDEGNAKLNHLPLFIALKTGHVLNHVSWVNGRLFSWLPGVVYVTAYNELANEKNNAAPEQKTQIIAGITVTYYLSATNKKICLADQADNVAAIYTATGAADFYLLDTEKQQFKLPRPNARRLLRTWTQGNEWYNLYSDGWCEQGGALTVANNANVSINLPVAYKTGNYHVQATHAFQSNGVYEGRHAMVLDGTLTATAFQIKNSRFSGETTSAMKITWQASGYADTSLLQDDFEYEYYFVGSSIQNETHINAGALSESLTSKADVDLSNTTVSRTFKEMIMSWLIPDYTSPTTLTAGTIFVAPCHGYLNCADARSGTGSGTVKITVNGVNIRVWEWQGNYAANTYQYIVAKNDHILVTVQEAALACVFYPMKGANNG